MGMNETHSKTLSLSGKTAIVTGANTGIGRVTARELARQGAHVILAGRSKERTEEPLAEIRQLGAGSAEFLALDLGSLASVREASAILVKRDQPIDLLINNAGLAGHKGLTQDGFEMTFGTNHIGHFAFTIPLLPLLLRAKAPRIVNVASRAHENVKKLSYDGVRTPIASATGMAEYSLSKLANVLFSMELHHRYAAQGLKAYSLHPGVVASDVWRAVPWPLRSLIKLFMISNEEGAATTLYCATNEGAQEGLYYDKSKPKKTNVLATREAAADLWTKSEGWIR
jgi:retinol dehydrogenase 12